MSAHSDSRHEQPGAYVVQDRASEEEMRRLQIQDEMLNASMGGLLPEQDDPARFTSVLDVGCGTGGWLIELAQTYPHISRLFGVDVSSKMLAFAREQAAVAGVAERVQFIVMDALRMLEFPDAFFDLVNQRVGASWLRTWDWSKLLQEYLRVTRPEGVIRITEFDMLPTSPNSPALMQLSEFTLQALYQSGRFFTPTRDGIIRELERLLSQHSIPDLQARSYTLTYHASAREGQLFIEDVKHLFRTMKPFMQKWTHLPEDYEQIYQQMAHEMSQPDFMATMRYLTVWGRKL